MLEEVEQNRLSYGDYFWNILAKEDLPEIVTFQWAERLTKVSKTTKEYLENGRFATRLYWQVWMDHPELARGCQTMLQIRCGEWKQDMWTGHQIDPS